MKQDPYQQQPHPEQQQYQQGYAPGNPYKSQQNYNQPDPQFQQTYRKPLARQQSLDRRSLIGGIGGAIALLGFFLPYFATYSGHELASLYGMYWLDIVFTVAAFVLLAIRVLLPSLIAPRRQGLILIALGVAGALLHYVIVNLDSTPAYWDIGAWLYFLGMIVVAISGIFLLL